jgi:ribosomal protein S18 acetylase RimI-like enzyme
MPEGQGGVKPPLFQDIIFPMSTLSISLPAEQNIGKMRPLNIMRDLPKVADLVELCFHKNMDREGQRYVQQMRDASLNKRYLNWASTSLPLMGYVWEDQKEIIGNISVIPFRKGNFLLANIAVHPAHRRKGIARYLTQKGMAYVRQRGAKSIWLHVEEDNHGAIKLYENLGFEIKTHRTTWSVPKNIDKELKKSNQPVVIRPSRFWQQQMQWLTQNYPAEISWYRMPDFQIFSPSIKYWLYRIFVENDIRQWSIQKDGELQAVLSWMQTRTRRSPIWLATTPQADAASLAALLLHARLHLAPQQVELYLDYPASQNVAAFEMAGLIPLRTLAWMHVDGNKTAT